MKLLVIHISDIHIKTSDKKVIDKKVDKLFDSVKNRLNEVNNCMLVVSGDIAFSGKVEEYQIAGKAIDQLIARFKDYSKIECHVVMIPGNHDCLFDSNQEKIRRLAIENFRKNGINNGDPELLDLCCGPLTNYLSFSAKYNSATTIFSHKLLDKHEFTFGDVTVNLMAYNTAWFSELNETPGAMTYPIELFQEQWETGNSNLVISALHHPFNWQQPDQARTFKKHIETTSDVVLSGHEHQGSSSALSNLDGNNTWYIEAPVFRDSSRANNSGFNLIFFDFNDGKIRIESSDYDAGIYKTKSDTDWLEFLRGSDLKTRKVTVNTGFLKRLENPGASFSHPSGEELQLSDVFVYPNLENITPKFDGKVKSEVISSQEVISLKPAEELRILILGDETSGKTALCKYFFKTMYDSGLVPILLSGTDINGINHDQVKTIIQTAFEEQYHKNEYLQFSQLDLANVVIFIDDFHLVKFKREYKHTFIENITTLYKNIVITGSKIIQYEDLAGMDSLNIYEDFEQFQILECGPELRHELIQKWNSLNDRFYSNINELHKKNDQAKAFVNNIVRKNLIPAHPFFVLTMLQALETAEGQSQEYSIHGYYYQLIINKALAKAVGNSKNIGAYHNFITQYCYFLFQQGIRFKALQINDFRNFFLDFCRRFEIETISFETAKEVLTSGKLVTIENDQVRIAYKYVYYYYVAKYLADNISKPDISAQVRSMCERVYREEYSNILMFLVHLEKSPIILDELLGNAKNIFAEYEPARLESDINFINQLVDNIPVEVLEYHSEEEARRQELKYEAVEEKEIRKIESDELVNLEYNLSEDVSSLDVLPRLNRAIKTIEILGQVTKKHWAEIEGPKKLELAEETYLVGLRTLGFYFNLLKNNEAVLVEFVKDIVERRELWGKIDKKQLQEISNDLVFKFCSLASYGITKRISNSIGLEDLAPTFNQLLQKHPYKSVELTNLAIKLEHYKGLPEDDLIEFKEDNKTNYLCVSVLQYFVKNYFYLYRTTPEVKQRLCGKMNITMPTLRRIEATSKVRKSST